jgi:hypothetical protein
VQAGDPTFGSALRYLDSGAATVLAVGTCGVSGHAVIGADRVAGRLSWPELPAQVIKDARSMLGSHRAMYRTYCPGGTGGADVQVWMQSHPADDTPAPGNSGFAGTSPSRSSARH